MVKVKEMRSIPTGFPGEYAEPDFDDLNPNEICV